jgi:rhodanese-related sulfurtransferase
VDVPQIDIDEAAALLADGSASVIDVRQPEEYVEGHVPGAPLIPLGEVGERIAEVPSDGPLLVICRSGARSNKAAEHLRAQGIDARNVVGGTMAWIDAGHRVVTGADAGS